MWGRTESASPQLASGLYGKLPDEATLKRAAEPSITDKLSYHGKLPPEVMA